MKNFHQFSPRYNYERERRYPFLVAIDLIMHFGLSIAAITLTVIALSMALDVVLPDIARFAGL